MELHCGFNQSLLLTAAGQQDPKRDLGHFEQIMFLGLHCLLKLAALPLIKPRSIISAFLCNFSLLCVPAASMFEVPQSNPVS